MASQPARKRALTKFDKERQREDIKLLVFVSGYSIREAARLVGVNEDSACGWAAKERWTAQLQRIREMAQVKQGEELTSGNQTTEWPHSKALKSTAEVVAFDLAATHRQNRVLLTKGIHKAAVEIGEKMTGEEVVMAAASVKAIVGSAKELDGSWTDSSANRFAVSLNLNQIVSSGLITEIPEGVEVIEE